MSNTIHPRRPLFARTVPAGLLALGWLALGCGNPAVTPSPPPSFASPVVRALSENLGFTGGGAAVKIEGTGFLDAEGGAVVLFGDARASKVSFVGTTIIFATVPPHAAGLVDVVVSNPDGQSGRLANAYTYASPDTFDFNGEWEGTTQSDRGSLPFRFTIQGSRLIAVSCATSAMVTVSPAPAVSEGVFAFSGEGGLAIAGRLVSPLNAIGTVNLAPCANSEWTARRQGSH